MGTAAYLDADTRAPVGIAWEESACLLCDGADHLPILEAADALGAGLRFLLVQCKRCGLVYTNPRPADVSIQQFYPADYHCHREVRESQRTCPLQPHGQARLLDFGCGAGGFLQRMKAIGWHVTGLDLIEAAGVSDLPIHVGTLPFPLWQGPCFEAITMRQSLEHVHRPLDVLRAAHQLLTDDGRLLVTTPNFESFASRWFGPRWYGLDVPRHLTHFTPQTLRMMLGVAGFKNVELRQERKSSWIRHSARGGLLKTRIGSGFIGWWGYAIGRGDGLIAIAAK